MSLLSPELRRDRVLIGLSPNRLSAVRLSGQLRPTLAERYDMDLASDGGKDWQHAVTAAAALIAEHDWRAARIEVVLSNHFVHYLVLPAGQPLAPAEQDALAQLFFRNAYGDLARDWELRVSPAARSAATVASGVSRSLLEAVREACANAGKGRLQAIRPALMTVANRACHGIGKESGTLAIVEPGRITLAAIDGGEWHSVSGRAADGDGLPQLLDQENELLGRAPGGMLWLCDMSGAARIPTGSAWTPMRLLPALTGDARGVPGLAAWGMA